jgi:phosphatidate cytidylyltransferase
MKKRVISAIIMVLVFIPFLILGNTFYLVLGSVLGILSQWELIRLEKHIPAYMKFLSYMVCLLLMLYKHESYNYYDVVNFPVIASLFFIYSFSVIINGDLKKYNYKDGLWLMGITLMIGLMFNSFIKIRFIGLYEVVYCILIATITDSFALFGGKLFGKNKLCKEISPNKTIEGSIVGTLFGTIAGVVFYSLLIGNRSIWIIILLTFILSVFGQLGDLFFSSIKRNHKIKDFSNIIPGHGGILDRLDSLLFVIMGYLLYILII